MKNLSRMKLRHRFWWLNPAYLTAMAIDRMKAVLLACMILVICAGGAWAGSCSGSLPTFNCTCTGSGDAAAIQGKINLVPTCTSSDATSCVATINIAAGTCSIDGKLTWTNKNITIAGAGKSSTTLTDTLNGVFYINNRHGEGGYTLPPTTTTSGMTAYRASWVIKDMTVVLANYGSDGIAINDARWGTVPFIGWRITNVAISAPNSVNPIGVHPYGLNWGLIDHSSFINGSAGGFIGVKIHASIDNEYNGNQLQSYEGNYAWSLPIHLGSDEALYFEDNTFDGSASSSWQAAIDGETGAAAVFRRNVFKGAGVYVHTGEGGGPAGLGRSGGRKIEVYNNLMDGTATGQNMNYPVQGQNGYTGVVYDNAMTNYGDNSPRLDLYQGAAQGEAFDCTGRYYGNCWGLGTNCGNGSLDCQNWKSAYVNSNCTGNGTPYYCCTGTGTGYCLNTAPPQSYDGNHETVGWPCLDQGGRGCINGGCTLGVAQDSVPLYTWKNGPQCDCAGQTYPVAGSNCTSGSCCTGSTCGGVAVSAGYNMQWAINNYYKGYDVKNGIDSAHTYNGDRDYCAGTTSIPLPDAGGTKCGNHTLTYTAYQYPHPLNTGSTGSSTSGGHVGAGYVGAGWQ